MLIVKKKSSYKKTNTRGKNGIADVGEKKRHTRKRKLEAAHRQISDQTKISSNSSAIHADVGELTTDDVLMAVSVLLVVIGLRDPDLSLLTLLPRVRPLDVGLSRDAAPNTGP